MALILLLILAKKVYLLPPTLKDLQIFRFLKNASLVARLGPIPMAAFQPCLQVWLTSSLLADDLAVAVQMSFILGVGLSVVVGIGFYFGAGIFSKNVQVVLLIRIGMPFVAATQPINSLAFVFDGVNYGSSDFAYSAYSLASDHIPLFVIFQCKNAIFN